MYTLVTPNRRVETRLQAYVQQRPQIREKLGALIQNPRTALRAHPLQSKQAGVWSCSLGHDIRLLHTINDTEKELIVLAVGTHALYK